MKCKFHWACFNRYLMTSSRGHVTFLKNTLPKMLWTWKFGTVSTRWNGNSTEHVSTGIWWRHHEVTWHFWKTNFPKCYEHEIWTVGTRWKAKFHWACFNRYLMMSYTRSRDISEKTHFPKCSEHEIWAVGTRWKGNSIEHVSTGIWWRYHEVTWYFWKTYFPKTLWKWTLDSRY